MYHKGAEIRIHVWKKERSVFGRHSKLHPAKRQFFALLQVLQATRHLCLKAVEWEAVRSNIFSFPVAQIAQSSKNNTKKKEQKKNNYRKKAVFRYFRKSYLFSNRKTLITGNSKFISIYFEFKKYCKLRL